jgi:prophage antirepressor-like protein
MSNPALDCELKYIVNTDKTIWFQGKDVASVLGYSDTSQAIRKNVDIDDKCKFSALSGGVSQTGLTRNQLNTIFLNESGLYSLILSSKLASAKAFKRWITTDVLPAIRRNGSYQIGHKVSNYKQININNEYDLHTKVVAFLRKRFPTSLFTVSLGELQDTDAKRIKSYNMGYLGGTPDLIIHNLHKMYAGFAIEFKTPTGRGVVSPTQWKMLNIYAANDFKVLISNDYDDIIESLLDYFKGVQTRCPKCSRKYVSQKSLAKHIAKHHSEKTFLQSAKIESNLSVEQSKKIQNDFDDICMKIDSTLERLRERDPNLFKRHRDNNILWRSKKLLLIYPDN